MPLVTTDDFVIGNPAPKFKVVVRDIIFVTDTCIVFLDDEHSTYWWTKDAAPRERCKGFSTVLNRVAELEAIPIDVLKVSQRKAFRTLVAEGIARALEEEDTSSSAAVHDKAEQYIRARLSEVARFWYLRVALAAALLLSCGMAALAAVRGSIADRAFLGFSIAVIAGGLGSAFSLMTRAGAMHLDPAAGAKLHTYEAIARITSGALGALLVGLVIRSGLVLPALKHADSTIVVLICLVSGVSERLIPNLISELEKRFNADQQRPAQRG